MAKKASTSVKAKPAPVRAKPTPIRRPTLSSQFNQALEAGDGIFRLAPTWVPRSFLMPGRRLKLAAQDLYAYGARRGGIDERWFSSTTPAANEGAAWDEGLSYVVHDGRRAFTLREAIAHAGDALAGPEIWKKYQRWPVYS